MPPAARRKSSSSKAVASGSGSVAPKDGTDTPERRKLRNRLSQRAFRARQAMRIQELEERLEKSGGPDVAWSSQLQEQNAQLREQLLNVYKRATSMQISIAALATAAAQALGIDPSTERITSYADDTSTDSNHHSASPEQSVPQPPETVIDIDSLQDAPQAMIIPTEPDISTQPFEPLPIPSFAPSTHVGGSAYDLVEVAAGFQWPSSDMDYFPELEQVQQESETELATSRRVSVESFGQRPCQTLSLVPLSSNTIGAEHYQDLRDRAYIICDNMPTVKRTNSEFSDHIDAFEACLSAQAQCGPVVVSDNQLLSAIQLMISFFVNHSWTKMSSWETHTKTVTAVKDLSNWRMNRTFGNYERIVHQYKPTRLQMSITHPSVIDWIPWPSLRDKLILHHAANPKLDDVIRDIGMRYVLQADLSDLVQCNQPVLGYVSVLSLVNAIARGEGKETQQTATVYPNTPHPSSAMSAHQQNNYFSMPKLPAADANELFNSPALAKAAHELLGLGQGAAFKYRLDPSFFELYPELYDDKANIIAHGVRLHPNSKSFEKMYAQPRTLDHGVVSEYQDFSKIALDYVSV